MQADLAVPLETTASPSTEGAEFERIAADAEVASGVGLVLGTTKVPVDEAPPESRCMLSETSDAHFTIRRCFGWQDDRACGAP